MQADEFPRVMEFTIATWPQADRWPPATWDVWLDELGRFDLALVLRVLRDQALDVERAFPPNWPQVKARCSQAVARVQRQAAIRQGAEEGQW